VDQVRSFTPRTGHQGPQWEHRYSSTHSLTLVGGQRHVSAALPLGVPRYPLYRRLGEPQNRSRSVRKFSPPPVYDPRTVQAVASRCTDRADPAHQARSLVRHTASFLFNVKFEFCWVCPKAAGCTGICWPTHVEACALNSLLKNNRPVIIITLLSDLYNNSVMNGKVIGIFCLTSRRTKAGVVALPFNAGTFLESIIHPDHRSPPHNTFTGLK